MSHVVIALLVALGLGAWIYNKLMRTTGGNTRDSLIVTAIAAVFVFFLLWFLAGKLLPS